MNERCEISGPIHPLTGEPRRRNGHVRPELYQLVAQAPRRRRDTATGEQSVAVCFADDGRPVRLCKPLSNISKGASGSITLYDGETAGQTVTAKAIMAAVTGGGSAKWCTAFWDGTWFVLPGEC